MSYSNSTTHYNLPLPTGSDKSLFTDTNTAFQAIDAAIYSAETLVSQAGDDITALQGRMTTAEGNISDNADDITSLKGRMTAVEGVAAQNTTDIADVRSDAEDMITAHNEPTATSAHAYAIGDEFIYNDVLYRATAAIAIGDTIVPNTNCAATNVMTEINGINTSLSYVDEFTPTNVHANVTTYFKVQRYGSFATIHGQFVATNDISINEVLFNLGITIARPVAICLVGEGATNFNDLCYADTNGDVKHSGGALLAGQFMIDTTIYFN